MPVYSIQLPDQRTLDIEAADPQTAMQGAQEWHQSNPMPVGQDVGRSVLQSLKDTAINSAGMMGDIGKAGGAVGKLITDNLGFSNPDEPSKFQPMSPFPSSSLLKTATAPVLGKDYVPQTSEGGFAKTATDLAPMFLGPGGMVRKSISYAGSLGANQAASAMTDNPYIQTVATVAGGLPAWMGAGSKVGKLAVEDVLKSAEAGYKSPEVGGLAFKTLAIDDLATNIESELARAKANPRLARATNDIVDEMRTPINGKWHTYEDLQTTRELLEKQAGNFANPQEQRAATIALKSLTKYIDNIPQADVAAGNGPAASAKVSAARGDYASGKTAERVQEKLNNAEYQAASNNSGGNFSNKAKQQLRPLLTSKKQGRGLTEDELAQVESEVVPSGLGSSLRSASKVLGGGGGLGMLGSASAGAAAGAHLAGPIGGLIGGIGAPALGLAARKIGDAATRRNTDNIVQAILRRSPYGQGQPLPPTMMQSLLNAPPWLQKALISGLMPSLPIQEQRQPVK